MKLTDKITLTNEDCMELLKRTPDNYYELSIVDPPYGSEYDRFIYSLGAMSGSLTAYFFRQNYNLELCYNFVITK